MVGVIPVEGTVFQVVLVDGPAEFYYLLVETPKGAVLYINKQYVEQANGAQENIR